MAKLEIKSNIVDEITKVFYAWDGIEAISSQDVVDFINNMDANDSLIDLRIHCNGGNVTEGWRIYDALRHSGKQITATIEGMCASMASVIFLAAPKERRFAYKNATLCIHNPEACFLRGDYPERWTAEEVEAQAEKLRIQAETLRQEQQKIVDLYVERTGTDAETLQELMDKDTFVDMTKAIELGFVSSLIAENTAQINKPNNLHRMNNEKTTEVNTNLFQRMLNALGLGSIDEAKQKFKNMVITTTAGVEVTIEKESGKPAVGDLASPDGEHVTLDGTTLVIAEGKITKVTEPVNDIINPLDQSPVKQDGIQALLDKLFADFKAAKDELAQMTTTNDNNVQQIADLNSKIGTMQATIDDLTTRQITDEQQSVLAQVNDLGGIDLLKALKDKQSNGAPAGVANDQMGNKGGREGGPRLGQEFLDEVKKHHKSF